MHKGRKQILLFAYFIIGCIYAYSQYPSSYYEHLSVKDGLSQISVVSIYEDSEGFMWFGTRDGLNKYDGYNFTVYQALNGTISNNYIVSITEDKDNNLWVGTRKGLNRYDRLNNQFISYRRNSKDSLTISHDNINILFNDTKDRLWIGTNTGLNLYKKETDNIMRNPIPELSTGIVIYNIIEDPKRNLWIGTDKGLYVYSDDLVELKRYTHEPKNKNSIPTDRISALYYDSKGQLWVGLFQKGVCKYNLKDDNFIYYSEADGLNSNTIRCFEEDKEGNLLVGTFDGLNMYDPSTDRFINAYSNSHRNSHLPGTNFSIYDVHCDRAGTVWIGTYSGGISYYNPTCQRFHFHDPGMQGQKIYGIVGPIVEHSDGLWIGTEGGGLLFYDLNTHEYTYYQLPGTSSQTFSRNIVKSLLINDDQLYVGTAYSTVHRFDIKKRKFVETISPPWGNNYYALFLDSKQKLWIGSSGSRALGCMTADKQFVYPALENGQVFNPSNIRIVQEDSTGVFIIGSSGQGLYCYNENTKMLRQWKHISNDTASLSMDQIYSIIKTKEGDIWVGTPGGGIGRFDRNTEKFRNYNKSHGLSSNTIYTLLEDHNGRLWMSTSSGISMFDPQTELFKNYDRNNGIEITEFTPGSGVVTADNEIYFGGNDGFISFKPDELKSNNYMPPVVITGISINNNPLNTIEVYKSEPLRLTHEQSNITIEFSALNYLFQNQNQYAYKLEGFDKEWNYIGNRRVAYYTNIQPGSYTFRVKGSNNDGIWNEEGASFQIRILPPPWDTWWAWTLYILTALIIATLVIRYARIKARLENNIRIKQMEQENLEVLHQTKIKLFTSFAHELRTPLTLILSPLEDILHRDGLEHSLQNTLNLMYRNANRLLNTVNQLMDFRKKESGHLQIKAAEGNIVRFINEIVIAFNELARSRNIGFSYEYTISELPLWYDRDLLEKVVFNLLSNAFKNTPDEGEVRVFLSPKTLSELNVLYPEKIEKLPGKDFVLLKVEDTGSGIPKTELEKIFEPFYQVYRKETAHLFGTGLGLNFSRGVIDMHHGVIWAENRPEGGAVFHIILPLGSAHLQEHELEHSYKSSEDVNFYITKEMSGATSHTIEKTECGEFKYTVLIVEDNLDVRHYLKSHIAKYYNVLEAGDGKEALELAVNSLPDLVVSDIMMPVMDGIEFCRLMKEDIRTGHIPVILLTARITVHQIQEGLETGADEYITKPFNAGLLLTRIKNLIVSREKLKELFGKNHSSLFPELPTSSVDSRFMDSIYTYILDHLSESELNMDDFYKEIGMSRSGFYRKLKSLSDLSPVEIIRNTRMQFAAKYLKETDLPISEIAYKVGFSSPSYFTKTFKAFFDQSPSELRENK